MRDRSAPSRPTNAWRTRRFSTTRRATGSEPSIARRASSCRNATEVGDTRSRPRSSAPASAASPPGTTASTSHRSTVDGTTASCSSAPRVAASRRPTRASTASTTVDGTGSSAPTASTSVTKNGLPEVMANSRRASTGLAATQLPDRLLGQAPQRQPAGPAGGRHLAEQVLEGMVAGQLVVAVGQDEHGRQLGDPAGQVPQHVQGGLVGPMDVLHDQDRRVPRPVQLPRQRGQHGVPVAGAQRPGQPGPDGAGQIAERPKGPGRAQVVTVADQQPPLGRQQPAQRLDQARLADPGLAQDQHQPAVPGRRLAGGGRELGQLVLAFEDHRTCHPPSIAEALTVLDREESKDYYSSCSEEYNEGRRDAAPARTDLRRGDDRRAGLGRAGGGRAVAELGPAPPPGRGQPDGAGRAGQRRPAHAAEPH